MKNNPQGQRHAGKGKPRGFVLLMAVLILAAVTVVASGIFTAASGILDSAQASKNEAQARAAANYCLEQGRIFLDHYKNQGSSPVDFDGVLDPALNSHPSINGVSGSGATGADDYSDDFVPPVAKFGGTIIYIPSNESIQSGMRLAMHRYNYLPFGTNAGCAIRFDDNNDDVKNAFAYATDNNNSIGLLEGQGLNIPYRDRDLALMMTSIGMAPVSGSAATAYDSSTAHVTFRNLTNSGGSPGMVVGGNIALGANIAICGVGGFAAASISGTATPVCSCGDKAVPATYSGAAPTNCDYYAPGVGEQCSTTATIPPTPPALPCVAGGYVEAVPPTVTIPVPQPANLGANLSWLDSTGWQDPNNKQSLGANQMCEFWFRNRGDPANDTAAATAEGGNWSTYQTGLSVDYESFVWDHTDTAALGCDQPYYYTSANAPAGADGITTLAAFTTVCGAGHVIQHDCAVDPQAPATTTTVAGSPNQTLIKKPCRWAPVTDAGGVRQLDHGFTVTCKADQTPCWKMQIYSDDRTGADASIPALAGYTGGRNIQAGSWNAPIGTGAFAGVRILEHSDKLNNSGYDLEWWRPNNAKPLPNIKTQPAVPTITNFCNLTAQPCTKCDGTWWGWHDVSNDHVHFEAASCADQWPSPSILFFENAPNTTPWSGSNANRFHVVSDWGSTNAGTSNCQTALQRPVRTTVLVKGHADVALNTQICGVFSSCGDPGVTTGTNSWPPDPCDKTQVGRSNGLVLRGQGDCFFDLGSVIIGDVQCGTIEMNQGTNLCSVSNMTSFNAAMAAPMMTAQHGLTGGNNICTKAGTSGISGWPACAAGICFDEAQTIVGNLTSTKDICINSGAVLSGSLLAVRNAAIQNNSLVNGQVVAGTSVGFANNVTINNDGTGKFGQKIGAARRSEPMY